MGFKKMLVGFTMAAVLMTGFVYSNQTAIIKANTQDAIVCDDDTCWKVEVTVADKVSMYVGKTKTLKLPITKLKGVKIRYKSSNISIAKVSSKGKIIGKKPGTAVITTTLSGKHIQKKLTFQTKVKVKALK